jgi:ribosome-associated heat shock protein Hsp15
VNGIRIDKWLWAARFFRTRSAAQQAIEGGRVKVNAERVKPAREVRVGDCVNVGIGHTSWLVSVVALSDRRGPASVARTLYREDEDSRLQREARQAQNAAAAAASPAYEGRGRPEKKQRRQLERMRAGQD